MWIFLNKDSKVIVQGITGNEGPSTPLGCSRPAPG